MSAECGGVGVMTDPTSSRGARGVGLFHGVFNNAYNNNKCALFSAFEVVGGPSNQSTNQSISVNSSSNVSEAARHCGCQCVPRTRRNIDTSCMSTGSFSEESLALASE